MFDDDATDDEICEFVLDGKVQEKVDSVVNESHREAISNFVKFDPIERWTVIDALQHPAFHPDPHTTTSHV